MSIANICKFVFLQHVNIRRDLPGLLNLKINLMKNENGKPKRAVIPTCTVIANVQLLAEMVITVDETKALNAFAYYLSITKGSAHLRMDRIYFRNAQRWQFVSCFLFTHLNPLNCFYKVLLPGVNIWPLPSLYTGFHHTYIAD